ncbi:uncharacterized protein SAPINGB_P002060 [Magnusiomyces paraingens]|uniref:MBA1-like protein n=1 Tax=Magnusiomyces paraingens TaxID=2606893 RepID=A0A5E8BJY9_9ASCO|nr:uncharacterized protein SAPINGB_P002060 [Saprochaete ingens]VVT49011.1 unnamed protein product [Saprochaete ingens]
MYLKPLVGSTSRIIGVRPVLTAALQAKQTATASMMVRYASNKTQSTQTMDIKYFGIPTDVYIPPSPKNVPPFYKNPKLALKSIIRKAIMLVKNTVFIAQFRLKSKISPRFVEWKNLALETYVDTNHAFAERRLDLVRDRLSLWVYESLKSRLESVPKDVKLNWKLVKFNSTPKIVSVQPLLLPGKPMREIQIIYKIDTRQRLARMSPHSKEPQVVEHDVVDYAAFTFDASKIPARVYFAGTVFESSLEDSLPVASEKAEEMMQSMKIKGDIFRSPPKLNLSKKAELEQKQESK